MNKLDAIILAGGLGTRLRELNLGLPKALVPVNGTPFLDILMNFLNRSDCIERVVIAVGFMSDAIVDRYQDCSDYNFFIAFSMEHELLGTGGAIKKALLLTEMQEILVLNGDSYVEVFLKDLIKFHRNRKADMTIALAQVEDAARYGLVKIDRGQRIIGFEEKKAHPGQGLINAGMYLFNRDLFDEIEPNKVLSIEKEILPRFLTKRLFGYVTHGKFIDIGIPEAYKRAGEYLERILA